MKGIFYGIGVGPGDPELMTMKAIKTVQSVDIIVTPKTEKKDGSVALNIASSYIKPETEILYQVFPMINLKKNADELSAQWESNMEEIMELLDQGKKVAFLTLGDPMFYSTYIYIFRLLKERGAQVKTIPGIPAFCAIGSYTGTPIVEGDSILSVIPANLEPERIEKALEACDNAVLMKVYKDFPEVADMLDRYDMAKNAVLVSRCGLDGEKIITDIVAERDKGTKLNYLSTILTRH